jgi:L-alanine-DL-glutamate epimerase-like enolase superfamily enzyme
MKITKVETVVYRNVTQVHAGGIGWTWVRIHTDTGAYGWGETFPAPDSEKAVILSDYAPVLLGRDPRDIERLWLPPDGFKNLQVRRRHGQMPARKMRDRPATVMVGDGQIHRVGRGCDFPGFR